MLLFSKFKFKQILNNLLIAVVFLFLKFLIIKNWANN